MYSMCRCELGTVNTKILRNYKYMFMLYVVMKIVIIASFMVRVFPIREMKPDGVYYLSTCTKLFSEIGPNYSICNLDR